MCPLPAGRGSGKVCPAVDATRLPAPAAWGAGQSPPLWHRHLGMPLPRRRARALPARAFVAPPGLPSIGLGPTRRNGLRLDAFAPPCDFAAMRPPIAQLRSASREPKARQFNGLATPDRSPRLGFIASLPFRGSTQRCATVAHAKAKTRAMRWANCTRSRWAAALLAPFHSLWHVRWTRWRRTQENGSVKSSGVTVRDAQEAQTPGSESWSRHHPHKQFNPCACTTFQPRTT